MFISIIIIFCIFHLNNYVLDTYSKNDEKLFDILHYYSPDKLVEFGFVSDFLTLFLLFHTMIRLYMKLIYFHDTNIYYFFKCLVLCQTVRKVITIMTILPDPSGICHEKPFKIILGRCNDLPVSGHTSTSILCYYFLREYNEANFIDFYVLINCLIIILVRNHYTIDVIFAFFMTSYLYQHFKYKKIFSFHSMYNTNLNSSYVKSNLIRVFA